MGEQLGITFWGPVVVLRKNRLASDPGQFYYVVRTVERGRPGSRPVGTEFEVPSALVTLVEQPPPPPTGSTGGDRG